MICFSWLLFLVLETQSTHRKKVKLNLLYFFKDDDIQVILCVLLFYEQTFMIEKLTYYVKSVCVHCKCSKHLLHNNFYPGTTQILLTINVNTRLHHYHWARSC